MKKQKNYLDYIPVKNPSLPWNRDDDGIVTVEVTHRGIAARIAQKAFNRPKVSRISLDVFGSFIWQQIDGEKNIFMIGEEVRGRFGKDAEPLYERLITFFRILHENRYITYKKM